MERVLRAVEQVPRGRVVSYGDVASLVGIGPRQVGSIMKAYGGNVAWCETLLAPARTIAGEVTAPAQRKRAAMSLQRLGACVPHRSRGNDRRTQRVYGTVAAVAALGLALFGRRLDSGDGRVSPV